MLCKIKLNKLNTFNKLLGVDKILSMSSDIPNTILT